MPDTSAQYDEVIAKCKDIFSKKMRDYGSSWRILRLSSLTDQIFIKANRIKTLEESGVSKVGDDEIGEFMAIVNYCVIAMIQIELGPSEEPAMDPQKADQLYDNHASKTKELMLAKNHDYGEAWRDMRISSYTDLMLVKLLRIKQIEENEGQTIVSEGVEANYQDILNYSVFALIKYLEAGKL
jgi:hypothetical protein